MSDIDKLVQACEKGDFASVQKLVEAHDVCKTGMSVEEMISKKGNDRHGSPFTPLQWAVKNEHLEIVQYLVKSCPIIDIIGQINDYGCNSIHYAAAISKKNVETLQFLIVNYNGKDIKDIINQNDNYGYTPLDLACEYNTSSARNDIVNLLRQYGAKANKYDENGKRVGDSNDLYDNITIKF